MQIGYILAGLVFFFNPNFEVIDLLPDFIGCALFLYGTRKLCILSDKGVLAYKSFRTLLLVNLAKCLSILTFLLLESAEMTWMLLFTSCFGVAEAYFFIRGMLAFLDALTYSAMRHDCDHVYGSEQTAFQGMTVIFALIKCLFSVLPELTYLVTGYGTVNVVETDWTFLWKVLQVVNLVVVTLFGIFFLLLAFRYFKGLRREDAFFLSQLEEEYRREILEKPGVLTYRHLKSAAAFLFLGMLFLLPFRLDGVDFLPEFVGTGLILAALCFLRQQYPKQVKKALPALIGWGVLSLAEWIYSLLFMISTHFSVLDENLILSYASYLNQYLHHDPSAYYVFLGLVALTVLRCVALVIALFLVYRVFAAIIREHTGAPEELHAHTTEQKTKAVQKRLNRMLTALRATTVLTAALGVLYQALFLQDLPLWAVYFFAALLTAVLGRWFTYALAEGMDNKYYYNERL